MRKCLYCSRNLRTVSFRPNLRQTGRPFDKTVVRCACGLSYSVETIRESDPERWEYLRKHKLFHMVKTDDPANPRMIFVEGGFGLNPKREKLKT